MLTEALAVTLLVIDAFEKLNVPYFIGGSLASALHGTARSTLDTDLVAELLSYKVTPLVELLDSEFYIDAEMIHEAIQLQSSFNLIHLATAFKVDVFIVKDRQFDTIQFQRRRIISVSDEPKRSAYITTAEDIILAKLDWYRLGGEISDRQWRDIIGVLKVQAGRLEMEYLQKWAGELMVSDLLQRAVEESQ